DYGNGIGLATVKKLVHALNGQVTLVSQPGKGSTFSFSMRKMLEIPKVDPEMIEKVSK
ncbi:MAG: ATPase, partial [Flavobacteriales bacterium]|nr:ATPase [Flavobacteriales bacterium]